MSTRARFILLLVSTVSAITVAAPVMASSIVINGGFESGSFAPWVVNGASSFPWAVTTSGPHSGTFDASTGCVGAPCSTPDPAASGAWLYQDLTTVASSTYSLSFGYDPVGGFANGLDVLWGASGSPLTNVLHLANTGVGFTQYSVSGLVAPTGTTRLEFLGRQDPSFNSLDDVAVCTPGDNSCGSATPVPEPTSMLLLGSGIMGLIAKRARRRA